MKKILIMVAAVLALSACEIYDTIYDKEAPVPPTVGTITLITDWTNRGEAVPIPTSYTVEMDTYTGLHTQLTQPIDHPFEAGAYRLHIHHPAENITLNGTELTADYATGTPGWMLACAMDATINPTINQEIIAHMQQQVRQLTLIITPTGGTAERIESITATLSGVAKTLNYDNGTHATPTDVTLHFTSITTGADAGKWTATVRLLGVTRSEQKLTGTIAFAEGNPTNMPLTADLSTSLTPFNTDKKTPFILEGEAMIIAETPTGTTPTATINQWNTIQGGPITAN